MNSLDMIARCAKGQGEQHWHTYDHIRFNKRTGEATLRADGRIVAYQPMTEADAEQEVTGHTGLALVAMAAGSGVVLLAVWAAWALALAVWG